MIYCFKACRPVYMCPYRCRHTHAYTSWHHMVLPIDLWNIQLLKCYVLILGLRLICLTSDENYYHTQRSVLTSGLILSPVFHVCCHLNVTISLKTFFVESILLIPSGSKIWLWIYPSCHSFWSTSLARWATTLDSCQSLRWPQCSCDVLAFWESEKTYGILEVIGSNFTG